MSRTPPAGKTELDLWDDDIVHHRKIRLKPVWNSGEGLTWNRSGPNESYDPPPKQLKVFQSVALA